MAERTHIRRAMAILTGLWVTMGAAVPLSFLLLTAIKAKNAGELGPELLSRPSITLVLLAGYALAASIGGWSAGWVTLEKKGALFTLLSLSHLGIWLFALAAGAVPLPSWFTLSLAVAAVIGSAAGIGVRAWQVGRRARLPNAD